MGHLRAGGCGPRVPRGRRRRTAGTPSYGGGVFFQMLTLNSVFHGAVAHGDEGTRFYVTMAFPSERQAPARARHAILAASRVARCARGCAALASAQDTHYWSIQYGPVGQLVGGQLIGGVNDLSATFYNPGALALRNESSYLLSTESFQWETLSTDPQPGSPCWTCPPRTSAPRPRCWPGVLPRWLGENTHLAWSFLTRQKLDVRLGQRVSNPLASNGRERGGDLLRPGREGRLGGAHLRAPLSDSLGLGLTWYGVYRGQRVRNELSVQAVDGERSLTASGRDRFRVHPLPDARQARLAWQGEPGRPDSRSRRPASGRSAAARPPYTVSLAGVDADRDGVRDPPDPGRRRAEDLDSDYKSSWAVGAGRRAACGAHQRLRERRVVRARGRASP